MAKKVKSSNRSKILDAVHQTAYGLHKIGLIDKRRMDKYDLFCLNKGYLK